MLTALNKITKEKYCIDDYSNNLDYLRQLPLVDPIFESEVFVRKNHFRNNGYTSVRSHFVLKNIDFDNIGDLLPDDEYFTETTNGYRISESLEHKEGKRYIGEYMLKFLENDDRDSVTVEYEKRVIIARKQGKRRVIDTALIFPDNRIIALECQLSPISTSELTDRILDYNSEGIENYWVLGRKANNSNNQNIINDLCGTVIDIIFEES